VTGRNLTESEQRFAQKRADLVNSVGSEYVADAPFVFLTRIQTTAMLSRIKLFELIREMPGSIVECGVYRGNSLMLLQQLSLTLEPYAINRTIYGFDTFEGFRSIDSRNDPKDITEEMFSDTNDELLRQIIELQDVVRPVNRIPKTHLVKGDIARTVPEFVRDNPGLCISLLILDTDLYDSTKVALMNFLPHMHKGAIVLLDEVCYSKFIGETIALKEVCDLRKVRLKKFPFDSTCGYFEVE
jgi:hypothetical protein